MVQIGYTDTLAVLEAVVNVPDIRCQLRSANVILPLTDPLLLALNAILAVEGVTGFTPITLVPENIEIIVVPAVIPPPDTTDIPGYNLMVPSIFPIDPKIVNG